MEDWDHWDPTIIVAIVGSVAAIVGAVAAGIAGVVGALGGALATGYLQLRATREQHKAARLQAQEDRERLDRAKRGEDQRAVATEVRDLVDNAITAAVDLRDAEDGFEGLAYACEVARRTVKSRIEEFHDPRMRVALQKALVAMQWAEHYHWEFGENVRPEKVQDSIYVLMGHAMRGDPIPDPDPLFLRIEKWRQEEAEEWAHRGKLDREARARDATKLLEAKRAQQAAETQAASPPPAVHTAEPTPTSEPDRIEEARDQREQGAES